jgi:hypothetical protein
MKDSIWPVSMVADIPVLQSWKNTTEEEVAALAQLWLAALLAQDSLHCSRNVLAAVQQAWPMKILGPLTRMRSILMSPPVIMGVVGDGQRRFLELVHWLVQACWQRAGGTAADSVRTILKWAATDLPTLALTAIPKTL